MMCYTFVMTKRSRMILMVAVTSLASQIYLNMFVDGFIIAMSPVMMAIFLYLFRDLNPVGACCLIALFSPLVRLIVMTWSSGLFLSSLYLVFPDVVFFLSYAFFFGVVFRHFGFHPYHNYYLHIMLCDFFSNCAELTARVGMGLGHYTLETFRGFLLLALARSLMITIVCILSDGYKRLLENREHEENYKRLLLMAATFNSEVYFMQKNMNEIEDIMKNAFTLYRTLQKEDCPQALKETSLSIAKDIHEVKRGYRRVIKGIQDNFLTAFRNNSRMYLNDLLQILSADSAKTQGSAGARPVFYASCETNHLIQKHFALMSILRNLIANSIDALAEMPANHRGEVFVRCRDVTKEGIDYCQIEVRDNGPGIPESIRDVLFVPGFSTKYDESTGDINRGLGLTLVRDLMEEKFSATIEVVDTETGAFFRLWFPVDKLTEQVNSYGTEEDDLIVNPPVHEQLPSQDISFDGGL